MARSICPGCDPCLEGHAYLFNAMNRFPDRSMIEKLWDLRERHPEPKEPIVDHPALHRYVELHRKIVQAMQGVVLDRMTFRWVPGVMQRLQHLGDEWRAVLVEVELLREVCQEDGRHRGRENVLGPGVRGSKHSLWGARTSEETRYDHRVRLAGPAEYGDIEHLGHYFTLPDHHKEKLEREPTFYARFWCSVCRCEVPWDEVTVRWPRP